MGRGRSHEIIEYRNKITDFLTSSESIVALLDSTLEDAPDDLPYKSIYPHERVPKTVTETKKFVNFDINAVYDKDNSVYKDLTIAFFIFCHEDVERTSKGLWYDRVVQEVDEIFGDKNILGIGKMALRTNAPYSPQENFNGRIITFITKDFTNGRRYGK